MFYTLEVRNVKNERKFIELRSELFRREIIDLILDNGDYPVTRTNTGTKHFDAIFYPTENASWKKHAEDMVMISEKFPEMYFELTGKGYNSDLFWKEYYHDGIIEFCRGEVVYEQPKRIQWQELIQF